MESVLEALKTVDKKLWIFLGAIFVLAVVAIVGTKIYFNMNNASLSYSEVELKLTNAAKEYYNDNKNLLPKTEGGSVAVNSNDLVTNKYIKSLDKMVKNDKNCTGKVVVKNVKGKYTYTTYLNCSKYSTTELYKTVTKNIVTTGKGLYNINGEYVFRGEGVHNYVKFDNKLWQIIKIDSSNNALLVFSDEHKLLPKTVWDDRYNAEFDMTNGINDFSVSRVKDTLNSLYRKDTILSAEAKAKIIPYDLCVGGRSEDSTAGNNSLECAKKEVNQYFGLITASDFITASLDANCKSPESNSCQNYNYLKYDYTYWTLTPDTYKSFKVFSIDSSLYGANASNEKYLRITVKLDNSVMLSSGKGTRSNPYMIN